MMDTPICDFAAAYDRSSPLRLHMPGHKGLKVLGMEVTRSAASEKHNACAIFNLRLNKHCSTEELMNALYQEEGVVSAEEL